MQAAHNPDAAKGLADFDKALFGHIAFTITHAFGALFKGLTGSHFVSVPDNVAPETRRYYQQLTRFSAAFAFLSDISMLVMGGELKRREKLSARLGDILSMMYLCSATLKRYESEGRQKEDAPMMHWAIWDAMYKAQMAFDGVIDNFPNKFIGRMLYRIIFPLGKPYDVPSDKIGHQVAKLLISPSASRDRLTAETYVPKVETEAVGAVELALKATIEAEPIEAKIRAAEKEGKLDNNPDANVRDLAQAAFAGGIVTAAEYAVLKRRNELRDIVIRVDDFPMDFGLSALQPAPHKAAA